MDQFKQFHDLFLDWNSKVNLISRKDTEHFYERHILHSLVIAKHIEFSEDAKIMDVGTGGGLPGIPLAIMFPSTQFLLIDSIGKKIRAVSDMAAQLKLTNVETRQDRCENVSDQFDFIVSRAVAPIGKIHGWVRGKLKSHSQHEIQNGYLLLKGGDLREEITESKRKVESSNLSNFYSEEFFETKKLLYVT